MVEGLQTGVDVVIMPSGGVTCTRRVSLVTDSLKIFYSILFFVLFFVTGTFIWDSGRPTKIHSVKALVVLKF